ncbi:MAG: glycosyltransferase [Chlamydiota bacterium]
MTKKDPLISVITPSYNRSKYHNRLYECFISQTYPQKELRILDDSPEPSIFFTNLKDTRIHYTHSSTRQTIGEKRNYLLNEAKGEIIAHFDDDDFYTPSYLRFMTNQLDSSQALVKLVSWFIYDEEHQTFSYWDTTHLSPFHFIVQANCPLKVVKGQGEFDHDFILDTLWGFGFSYVYHRSIYPDITFEPQDNFGEDLHFIQKIKKAELPCRAILDTEGLALHVIHRSNISRVFPQFLLPSFIIEKSFSELLKIKLYL